MKNAFRFLPLLVLSIFLPAKAVGPVFVNLVPITGLPSATSASLADSNLVYVVTGSALTTYKKISLYGFKNYLITQSLDSTYRFTDTVTGYSTVVTDSVVCHRAFGSRNVTCRIGTATGTSNATAHRLMHFPSALAVTTAQLVTLAQITDTSTVFYSVKATISTDTLTFSNNGTAFKNSGTFAITNGTTFSYIAE